MSRRHPRTVWSNGPAHAGRGLSLLEIIVALAVLTGTAAILAQMVSLGARHAERSRQITEAQTIAHNILSELLAGVRPWETSETLQPVDLWSPWDFQLRFEPVGFGNLVAATVTVAERSVAEPQNDIELPSLDQAQVNNPRHYHLTRWVRHDLDPNEGFPTIPGQGSPAPSPP